MDALTNWIAQLSNPFLTDVARLFANELVLVAIIIALIVWGEKRKEKVWKIVLAVFLAFLLSTALKLALRTERPCGLLHSKVECPWAEFPNPWTYSFPSGHTLVAFTVALAFLNKREFPFYLAFALFVAFTRIYLGVHTFEDVAGSIALAPFVYYITDVIWKKFEEGKYAARHKLNH